MTDRETRLWALGFTAIILATYLLICLGCAYFEARAFNSATGKNVSTWDALFIELRVQESAK